MTQLYMDVSSDVNNKYYLIYPFFPDIWSQGPKVPRSQGPKVPGSQGPKVLNIGSDLPVGPHDTVVYGRVSSDVNNKYYLIYPFFPDIWSQGPKVPMSQGPKVPRSLISVQSEPIEGRSLID